MIKKVTKAKKAAKTDVKILEDLVNKLFSMLSLKSIAEVSDDAENDALSVNIKGEEESGLLIGARGRTLSSIQTILSLMFRQTTGNWKRIIVNVADYREKEEQRLKTMAEETALRAKETGEVQYLYNLTGAQRRIVHMALSENKDIKTESQGEGSDRFLIVSSAK